MLASDRLIKVGTPTQRRCATCGRKIKKGNEHFLDGKYYGGECIYRILDRLNAKGKSE